MDDIELIRQARHDPEAVGSLYDRYVDPIYRYVQHRVNDPSHIERIVAAIFRTLVDAVASPKRWQPPFRVWLYSVASKEVEQWWHSVNESPESHRDQTDQSEGLKRPPVTLPDADGQRVIGALDRHFKSLDPVVKEVLELHFGHDLSHHEIAQVLCLDPSTVRRMMGQAIQSLNTRSDD